MHLRVKRGEGRCFSHGGGARNEGQNGMGEGGTRRQLCCVWRPRGQGVAEQGLGVSLLPLETHSENCCCADSHTPP